VGAGGGGESESWHNKQIRSGERAAKENAEDEDMVAEGWLNTFYEWLFKNQKWRESHIRKWRG
jgi:hypothetical protein